MKKLPLFSVCALVALSLSSFASDIQQAARYKLVDASSGRSVDLAALKGKYKAIYIDFFANWCGPCQGEIKHTIKLHNQLAGKGVYFIGLDVWDQVSAMRKDMQRQGINYAVYHDSAPAQKGIAPLLGVSQLPVVFILNGKTLKPEGRWDNYYPAQDAQIRTAQLKVLAKLGVHS